ncbi:MotA/TolQ/ExbB proton channel family protein [Caldimonas tepidiphila]|uniref:MotA/TolQ/ExbB proton channel family protein n=1 Tax=Caldimonas tepidiphila TaxID=2315841 RepID=UPI000E5A3127|nr:MotA/TolQ/ExbB proton channel family protein [Caldimonas tepidiphila]
MDGLAQLVGQGDAVLLAVALLLLAMSVGAWIVILRQGRVLRRAGRDLGRAVPAFWAAPSMDEGRLRLEALDREAVALPLLDAALRAPCADTLEAGGSSESQLTRRLRDALHAVLRRLQSGQVLLASIGTTAPFVGLFGTVWGVHRALAGLSGDGGFTIERISAPVGEALVMTAAGLAVAIPAVLAYNVFGRWVGQCEAELEGFAHDLLELAGRAGAAAER